MNAITGLALAAAVAPQALGGDSSLYRQCAVLLAQGQTEFCGSLYSPLMALAARPLTWMPLPTSIAAMSLLSLGILLVGVILETRGHAFVDRVLTAVAVAAFAPVVYELTLGQTTVLIIAAMYPVVRSSDRFRNGMPLGIALALAPKPLLLPALVWMFVWRRRSLFAALLTAVSLSAAGAALLGFGQYVEWVRVLAGAGSQSISGTFILGLHERGNSSLWPLTPATFALACVVIIATAWAIRRDRDRGLAAALVAGLLLAPYTMLYAYSILLLAVRPALRLAPRGTRLLAVTANLSLVPATMMLWTLAALVALLPVSRLRASLDRGLRRRGTGQFLAAHDPPVSQSPEGREVTTR